MSYSLFKDAKSGNWHYRFQIAGARVQRSTRTSVKGKADAVARRAYDEVVTKANGGKSAPRLREQFANWLVVHELTASAAHRRSVETIGRLHLFDMGEKAVNDITTADIERSRNKYLETHSFASANHWLRVMKLITRWTLERGEIKAMPWKVSMLKVQKRPRATLPIDIAQVWFDAVDDVCRRNQAVATAIRLMFGAGLRESEAASARWEWIDWQRKEYTPGVTKGREADPVPLPQWLIDYLASFRKAEGLICTRMNGTALPAQFSRIPIRAANTKCKIKGITPHRLRGTFATLLSENRVPVQTIQKVLRHKHPMTTMAYLEANLELAANAQEAIADKTGMSRRENGEALQSNPTEC